MLLNLISLSTCFALCFSSSYARNPEVNISSGRMKGSFMQTARYNKTIFAFRGVRYAKSTEGEKRFKIAEPVDPWNGVFDASQDGPSCGLLDPLEIVSEDCLRLNVYTTKLPSAIDRVKRPVVVFFHPSGFVSHSARSDIHGPEYFLDQDIVLVTINSRLALFGFISTGDSRAPGNLGLKDQVIALRWIQKNIRAFGGDPKSVTLSGCSAGSAGIVLHMLSPMSKGLFHRAFVSSGSPEMRMLTSTNETHVLRAQAHIVGCPNDDVDEAIRCLKAVPLRKYAETYPKLIQVFGIRIWIPVVEPKVPGVETFLPGQPAYLIRQGKFAHVPLILGSTKDEFLSSVIRDYEAALKGDDSAFRALNENWDVMLPSKFKYESGTEFSKKVSRELKKFYFNNLPVTIENAFTLGKMWSDGGIGFSSYRTTKLLAQYSRAPVYNFMFAYQGRYSYGVWTDTKKPIGVVHMDDIIYYMTSKLEFARFERNGPEFAMVEKMTSLWANFANTGVPIPKGNSLFKDVTWTPFDLQRENYLEIGEKFITKYKMYADRFALWEKLFPLTFIGL